MGIRRGRGVIIAHPSPGLRMRLAMAFIDRHPVFLSNGVAGLLRQVGEIVAGRARAPEAFVLGTEALTALRSDRAWPQIEAWRPTIVVIGARPTATEPDHHAFHRAPHPSRILDLLAA